jgi:hydrogenase expression/formation protein HypC
MCLAIPGKVVDTYEESGLLMGKVDFNGITKRICLAHVPDVRPGDYVVVHVGFALSVIDTAAAEQVFRLLDEINALAPLEN